MFFCVLFVMLYMHCLWFSEITLCIHTHTHTQSFYNNLLIVCVWNKQTVALQYTLCGMYEVVVLLCDKIHILLRWMNYVIAFKCSLLCLKVHFITDTKRLSLNSTDNDASDIDELIYCFAVAFLRIFPAAFRWSWLWFNIECDRNLDIRYVISVCLWWCDKH